MKFLEQLEKLAQKYKSTWGGDDAGELFCTMLEEGLAYGTKTEMVEILPEQSVTNEGSEDWFEDMGCYIKVLREPENNIPVKSDTYYIVVLNDKQYKVKSMEDDGVGIHINFDDGNYVSIFVDSDGTIIHWPFNFGETITLAIYEEQEVVKQLDAKFVGASGAKTEKLLDITFTEPTASIRIDLEHNFHRLFLVWNGGDKPRTVDTSGNATAGSLRVVLNDTNVANNHRTVGAYKTSTSTWQTHGIEMKWSDDLSTYMGHISFPVANGLAPQSVTTLLFAADALIGTIRESYTDGPPNAPIKGSYIYITTKDGDFFNTGTRMIMVGEYYE